ncbi:YcjF family protein [Azospirillum sp. B506]|uniref:YcjF family protein n=1 Tax=Azospirillum sp. B506 TaxID=137721 RepID=UPI0003449CDD|nr:DUF697 domain-containing protein [Azospirillum sp. B506]
MTEEAVKAAAVVPVEADRKAENIIKTYSKWNVLSGLIPLPYLDIVAVTGVQVKMIGEIADAYGVPFSPDRTRSIVGALLGGIVPHNLAAGSFGSLVKSIPVVGTILGVATMPALAAASTYAVGKVFQQHFAAGGTLLDFNPEKWRSAVREQMAAAEAGTPAAAPANGKDHPEPVAI